MKVVHVYSNSCEYAYPKYLDRKLDPDAFDREIIAYTPLELRYLKGLREIGVDCAFLYPTRFRKPVKEFVHNDCYRMIRCPVTFWKGKLGYEISIPLLRQLKKEEPDIIHFHGIYRNTRYPDMFDITALFCKLHSIPFVGQYHTGQFPPYFSKGQKLRILKNMVMFPKRILKMFALRSSSGICSVNRVELERLFNPSHPDYYGIDFSKIPHRLLPNTFDSDLFHPIPRSKALKLTSLDGGKKYILMVSRLFYEKGLHHLIRVMPWIIKRFPNVNLLIAGDFLDQSADYKKMVDSLLIDLGIKDNVTFLGRVEHHKGLPYYYNVADAFVLPSYGESFGGVILEAIACGVPVVVTPVSEVPYLVKPSVGMIVPFKDEEKLLEAIIRVLSGEFIKDEKQQRQIVEQYDYKKISVSLINWYERLLSNKEKTKKIP